MIGPTTNHREIQRWAAKYGAVPVEEPLAFEEEPPRQLSLIQVSIDRGYTGGRVLPWEEFFRRFDALGLVFVASDNGTCFNELLQQAENQSPCRKPHYRVLSCLAAS